MIIMVQYESTRSVIHGGRMCSRRKYKNDDDNRGINAILREMGWSHKKIGETLLHQIFDVDGVVIFTGDVAEVRQWLQRGAQHDFKPADQSHSVCSVCGITEGP